MQDQDKKFQIFFANKNVSMQVNKKDFEWMKFYLRLSLEKMH